MSLKVIKKKKSLTSVSENNFAPNGAIILVKWMNILKQKDSSKIFK